jgi:hypothetical protein
MEYVFKSLATPDTAVTVIVKGTKKTVAFRSGVFKTHDPAVANALTTGSSHRKYYVMISEAKADEIIKAENTEGTNGTLEAIGTNETEVESPKPEGTLGTNETNGTLETDALPDDAVRFKTVNEAKDYLVSKGAPASKMLTVASCTEWAKANGINIVIKR